MRLPDETTDDGPENRPHEGGVGEDGKGIHALHGGPEIGYGPPGAGERGGTEKPGQEAEDELRGEIGGERGCHDPDHVYEEGGNVYWVSPDRFGYRSYGTYQHVSFKNLIYLYWS